MSAEPVDPPAQSNRRVLVGLAIVLLGVALFVAQRAEWEVDWSSEWWPLLLIALGLIRFIDPGIVDGRSRSRRNGFWLMSIGVWAWISQAGLFGLDYSTSWPLLIIITGVSIAWRALEGPPARGNRPQEN